MAKFKKYFHYFIYLNFITGFISSLYMVFIVYKPESHSGPLWSIAKELPHEFLIQRRLYALEAWVIFIGLALYFAITSKDNR